MAEPAESESGGGASSSSEIYLNDLADVQTYLERLQQLLAECGADDITGGDDNDDVSVLRQFSGDEYLTALRVKQLQLDGVREHARRHADDPTSPLLVEMLDVVEPLCRDLIQTLARSVSRVSGTTWGGGHSLS